MMDDAQAVTRRVTVEITIPTDSGSFGVTYRSGDDGLLITIPQGIDLSSEQVERMLNAIIRVAENRENGGKITPARLRELRNDARSHVEKMLGVFGVDPDFCQGVSINRIADILSRKLGVTTRQITRWIRCESTPDEASIRNILAGIPEELPPEKKRLIEVELNLLQLCRI